MKKFGIVACATILALAFMLPTGRVAYAEEFRCRGTLGAVTKDNIFVPDGATCTLNGTRAKGTVKVGTNATLRATSINVVGNIQAEGAKYVDVRASTIGGNIQIKQGQSAFIARNTINGDLQFDSQRGLVTANYNRIGGNLQAFKNTGGLRFTGNRIAENMQCKENRPAPTGSGNIAGDYEDQCAKFSASGVTTTTPVYLPLVVQR
jgi:hypothetical protein